MDLFTIETLFLTFIIYSFLGWFIETIGDFIKHRKFINRGFLLGPYCPIYGTGVILITLLLSKYANDAIVLFFLSMIICGTLEYLTSYIMEKVFKSRWWDYSNMKFNINGRICLETLILFGIAGVLILHSFNPFFLDIISKIPNIALHIITILLFIIFLTDFIISLNIMNSIKIIKISVANQIKDNTDEISSKVKEILMKKSTPYRRFLLAFPQAFANKLKEGKEKIEKTAEKVKDNFQDVKGKALDNFQNIKDKASDSLQEIKEKIKPNIDEKQIRFTQTYKSKIKLSLMKIYKKK